MPIPDARTSLVLAAAAAIALLTACEREPEEAPTAPPASAPAEEARARPADVRDTGALAPAGAPAPAPGAAAANPPAPPAPVAGPEPPRPLPTPGPGGARMVFDETVHDFGVVWDVQADLPCEFAFRNAGTSTLEILEMKPDCGCTVPELSKRRFEPGESGVIKVLYTPRGFGPGEKHIALVTNAGAQPVTRVSIRADNQRFVWADPPNVKLEPAKLREPHRVVVTIHSADPDFVIEQVYATQGSVHATGESDFLEVRLIEGTSPPQIEIVLTDGAPWGSSFCLAHVEGHGTIPGGGRHDFKIPVTVKADLFDEIRADRTYYTLKLIPPGASFEQTVRLWRESGEPFEVSAEIENATMPGMRVEAKPIENGDVTGYDVVLSGETGGYLGTVKGSVIVRTDVPGEELLELRFSGIVQDASK